MARKKEAPKPISTLRFDFIDSLENLCHQSIMLLQVVDSILQQDLLKPAIAEMLTERSKALRAALISEE